MTIVLFIAVLFFLILVHELGHFLTAKWAKMRVDEFAIGFPPRLFSLKKGETEYSINLLPIGGYVKIFGENGADIADGPRSFTSRPRLHQAIVLLAGVAMNILTAWLIFFTVAMIGTPTAIDESEAGANASLRVVSIVADSPAQASSIPIGATITNIQAEHDEPDSRGIDRLTPSSVSALVAANPTSEIRVFYTHKGEQRMATMTPATGVIAADPDRPAIGLSTTLVEMYRESPLTAFVSASVRTWESLKAITIGIVSFLGSAFTLSADIEQVTGPIGIAGMVGEAAEFGFTSLLIFTAFISLNLAVINLLPIPALDGGRLLFVIAEAIIRRPIDPEWMARVNFIGFALLILLMLAVTYNDILRLF